MPSSSPLVHFQIASPDPEATQAFLKAVFDWDFRPGGGRVVANIDTGARLVDPNDIYPSGTLISIAPEAAPYTAIFIRVADLDAAVERALANGATVLVKRSRTPQGTDVSIIRAPQGHTFGIVQL